MEAVAEAVAEAEAEAEQKKRNPSRKENGRICWISEMCENFQNYADIGRKEMPSQPTRKSRNGRESPSSQNPRYALIIRLVIIII